MELAISGESDSLSVCSALIIADVVQVLSVITLADSKTTLNPAWAPALSEAVGLVATPAVQVLLLIVCASVINPLLAIDQTIFIRVFIHIRGDKAGLAHAGLGVLQIYSVKARALAGVRPCQGLGRPSTLFAGQESNLVSIGP